MKKVQRFARLEIQKDAITRTPEGFLIVPVTATRTGVLPYAKEDGSVSREARIPDEVFSDKSIASMKGIPVTNEHPVDLVTAHNATSLTKGWTGHDVKTRDGRYLETTVKIVDEATIAQVLDGKHEVSMGYEVEKDESPGRFDGEEYDVIQRNIRYNHLAIVTKGRAGPDVKLRLDAADNEILNSDEGGEMKKVKLGDKEFEVTQDLCDAIAKFGKDAVKAFDINLKEWAEEETSEHEEEGDEDESEEDESDEDSAEEQGRGKPDLKKTKEGKDSADTAKLKAENSRLQARLDDAEEKLKKEPKMDRKEVELVAQELSRTQRVAEVVLDSKEIEALAGKDSAEIKRAIVKKVSPTVSDEKLKNHVYVDARFDAIAERALATNRDEWTKFSPIQPAPETTAVFDEDAIRKKNFERAANAWKQPTSLVMS